MRFKGASSQTHWRQGNELTYPIDSTFVGVSSIYIWRTERIRSTAVFRQITRTRGWSALRGGWPQLFIHTCTKLKPITPPEVILLHAQREL